MLRRYSSEALKGKAGRTNSKDKNPQTRCKMYRIQEIDFPADCTVISHDFYTYDPVSSFTESDSMKYLKEDILQCSYPDKSVVIDLGWYGYLLTNQGEFQIKVIRNSNWEFPESVIFAKSTEEAKSTLTKVLQYYSDIDFETEPKIG